MEKEQNENKKVRFAFYTNEEIANKIKKYAKKNSLSVSSFVAHATIKLIDEEERKEKQ